PRSAPILAANSRVSSYADVKKKKPETPANLRADTSATAQELLTAELAGQLLSRRPDRLIDVAVGQLPAADHARRELANVRETLATLALVDRAKKPGPGLAARIKKTVAKKARVPKKALLVIDMLNDHLTPGRPLEVPRARDVVPAVQKRIAQARKDRMPVVYVCDEHDPNDSDLEEWAVHNVRGTEGAEVWPALAPKAGDAIVKKPTYSAFSRSNLEGVLGKLGVDTLVMTGCATELGMLATAMEALQRGYAIEIPPDSQAGVSESSEQTALTILSLMPPYGPAREELLARR
ncbi:MAG: cysteine hydrolase family protein, partial [Polyangiaceae bacterium]